MRGEHRDDTTRMAPVLADEPVEVHNPRRKLRLLTLLFASAIILSAAASAYVATIIAYQQSTRHTDQRIATLEKDLAQRRAERAERDRQMQELLEQYRRTICTLAGQHSGPEIDRLRVDFRCDQTPAPQAVAPSPSALVSPRATPRGTSTPGSLRAPGPQTTRATASRSPARTSPPTVTPAPSFCLPLLGCLPE